MLRALRPFGVWLGRRSIYLPKLLRPEAASLLGLLNAIWSRLEHLPAPPAAGLTSFARDAGLPGAFLAACGFRIVGTRAIRLDMLERVEETLEKAAAEGVAAEAVVPMLVSLLGSDNESLPGVLAALGWRVVEVSSSGEGARRVWRRDHVRRHNRRRGAPVEARPDSPFAELADLIATR